MFVKKKLSLISLGKGSKKILVEFSIKVGGWGQQWTDFPLFIFYFFLNISLNPLRLPKNYLKINLFFLNFSLRGVGGWGPISNGKFH